MKMRKSEDEIEDVDVFLVMRRGADSNGGC